MLKKIRNRLFNLYFRLVSSIAFLPSLISLLFFFLALTSLWIFDSEANDYLNKVVPGLIIDNADTARSVLSAFIGGIISLTSFSFSMVMLLLSQASSNFSPRLLPDLISDTRNQIVLGSFLGTIIFMVIILMSILPADGQTTTSGFSILLSIFFGLICLGMFVYFIHIMSMAIQIGNILKNVYENAKDRLQEQLEMDIQNDPLTIEEGEKWYAMSKDETGYFQGINLQGVLKKIEEEKVNIKLLPFKGKYTFPQENIISFDKAIDDEVKEEIFKYIVFSNNHQAADNYVLGIKQITEVGVKAMSPGINDPGTAIVSIDYITELLAMRMKLGEVEVHKSPNGKYAAEVTILDFDTIIHESLASYRQYCKHDFTVMRKLVEMMKYLTNCETKLDSYKDVIKRQITLIEQDVSSNIENKYDKEILLKRLKNMATT